MYFLSAMATQGVVCVFAWSYSCTCYCVTLSPIWCLLAGSYVYLFLSAMVALIAVLMMDILAIIYLQGPGEKNCSKINKQC